MLGGSSIPPSIGIRESHTYTHTPLLAPSHTHTPTFPHTHKYSPTLPSLSHTHARTYLIQHRNLRIVAPAKHAWVPPLLRPPPGVIVLWLCLLRVCMCRSVCSKQWIASRHTDAQPRVCVTKCARRNNDCIADIHTHTETCPTSPAVWLPGSGGRGRRCREEEQRRG